MKTVNLQILKNLGFLSDRAYSLFFLLWQKVESSENPTITVPQTYLRDALGLKNNGDYPILIEAAALELQKFVKIERKEFGISKNSKDKTKYRHFYSFTFLPGMFKNFKTKKGKEAFVYTPSASIVSELVKVRFGLKLYMFFQTYHGSEIRLFGPEFRAFFGFAANKKSREISEIFKKTQIILVGKFGYWAECLPYRSDYARVEMWHSRFAKVGPEVGENLEQIVDVVAEEVAESSKKIQNEIKKISAEEKIKNNFIEKFAGRLDKFRFKQLWWIVDADRNLICLDKNRPANLNEIKEFYQFILLKHQESQKLEVAA